MIEGLACLTTVAGLAFSLICRGPLKEGMQEAQKTRPFGSIQSYGSGITRIISLQEETKSGGKEIHAGVRSRSTFLYSRSFAPSRKTRWR